MLIKCFGRYRENIGFGNLGKNNMSRILALLLTFLRMHDHVNQRLYLLTHTHPAKTQAFCPYEAQCDYQQGSWQFLRLQCCMSVHSCCGVCSGCTHLITCLPGKSVEHLLIKICISMRVLWEAPLRVFEAPEALQTRGSCLSSWLFTRAGGQDWIVPQL